MVYRVCYKGPNGEDLELFCSAVSAAGAIQLAFESDTSLRLHPNRIVRIIKEES